MVRVIAGTERPGSVKLQEFYSSWLWEFKYK